MRTANILMITRAISSRQRKKCIDESKSLTQIEHITDNENIASQPSITQLTMADVKKRLKKYREDFFEEQIDTISEKQKIMDDKKIFKITKKPEVSEEHILEETEKVTNIYDEKQEETFEPVIKKEKIFEEKLPKHEEVEYEYEAARELARSPEVSEESIPEKIKEVAVALEEKPEEIIEPLVSKEKLFEEEIEKIPRKEEVEFKYEYEVEYEYAARELARSPEKIPGKEEVEYAVDVYAKAVRPEVSEEFIPAEEEFEPVITKEKIFEEELMKIPGKEEIEYEYEAARELARSPEVSEESIPEKIKEVAVALEEKPEEIFEPLVSKEKVFEEEIGKIPGKEEVEYAVDVYAEAVRPEVSEEFIPAEEEFEPVITKEKIFEEELMKIPGKDEYEYEYAARELARSPEVSEESIPEKIKEVAVALEEKPEEIFEPLVSKEKLFEEEIEKIPGKEEVEYAVDVYAKAVRPEVSEEFIPAEEEFEPVITKEKIFEEELMKIPGKEEVEYEYEAARELARSPEVSEESIPEKIKEVAVALEEKPEEIFEPLVSKEKVFEEEIGKIPGKEEVEYAVDVYAEAVRPEVSEEFIPAEEEFEPVITKEKIFEEELMKIPGKEEIERDVVGIAELTSAVISEESSLVVFKHAADDFGKRVEEISASLVGAVLEGKLELSSGREDAEIVFCDFDRSREFSDDSIPDESSDIIVHERFASTIDFDEQTAEQNARGLTTEPTIRESDGNEEDNGEPLAYSEDNTGTRETREEDMTEREKLLLIRNAKSNEESISFGEKLKSFGKRTGIVIGGVVAAPIALAALSTKLAYDYATKESEEEKLVPEREYEKQIFPERIKETGISEEPSPDKTRLVTTFDRKPKEETMVPRTEKQISDEELDLRGTKDVEESEYETPVFEEELIRRTEISEEPSPDETRLVTTFDRKPEEEAMVPKPEKQISEEELDLRSTKGEEESEYETPVFEEELIRRTEISEEPSPDETRLVTTFDRKPEEEAMVPKPEKQIYEISDEELDLTGRKDLEESEYETPVFEEELTRRIEISEEPSPDETRLVTTFDRKPEEETMVSKSEKPISDEEIDLEGQRDIEASITNVFHESIRTTEISRKPSPKIIMENAEFIPGEAEEKDEFAVILPGFSYERMKDRSSYDKDFPLDFHEQEQSTSGLEYGNEMDKIHDYASMEPSYSGEGFQRDDELDVKEQEHLPSSFGEKLKDFAKTAGMMAGSVIAAPVALTAVGASKVYDYAKKARHSEPLLEADMEGREEILERDVDVAKGIAAISADFTESEDTEKYRTSEPEEEMEEGTWPSTATLPISISLDRYEEDESKIAVKPSEFDKVRLPHFVNDQKIQKYESEIPQEEIYFPEIPGKESEQQKCKQFEKFYEDEYDTTKMIFTDKVINEKEERTDTEEDTERMSPFEIIDKTDIPISDEQLFEERKILETDDFYDETFEKIEKDEIQDEKKDESQYLTEIQFTDIIDKAIDKDFDEKSDNESEISSIILNRVINLCAKQLIDEVLKEISELFFENDENEFYAITTKSCSSKIIEHEDDYQTDLQEKLDLLAMESQKIHFNSFDKNFNESIRSEIEKEKVDEIYSSEISEMINDIIQKAEENLSNSDSATFKTAISTNYETCVTSQDDTFETALGSQESDYTTAPSGDSDISDTRYGSVTPIAMVSPVQSDRNFIALQDIEDFIPTNSKSSTPDAHEIVLMTTDDYEEDDDEKIHSAVSGSLIAPRMDPGRPISPIPPPALIEEEENDIDIVETMKIAYHFQKPQVAEDATIEKYPSQEESFISKDIPIVTSMSTTEKSQIIKRIPSDDMIHEKAMDLEKDLIRRYSDISSSSRADTVICKDSVEPQSTSNIDQITSTAITDMPCDSLDSLDKISIKSSSSSGKRYSTSRRSSNGSRKSPFEEPQTFIERLTPELKIIFTENDQESSKSPPISCLSPEQEFDNYSSKDLSVHTSEIQLETVDEEPEEIDSLNGRSGSSSNGQTIDSIIMAKYKHISSDNVSETSLQEFERIERDVMNKGESSLSGSEMELYIASKLKTTTNGSTSSLAEFERLEREVSEISPQEEIMILSDIREESEIESEMSTQDDDDDESDSIPEVKSIPVRDDTLVITPIASPTDSIEKDFVNVIPELLETSTDSLELCSSSMISHFIPIDKHLSTDYEIIDKTRENLHDSLENIMQDKDSVLEGASSQEMASQDTQLVLSGDTYQEYQDEDKDSLVGDMDTMLGEYPTTLTTYETVQLKEDGSVEKIYRQVLTRVRDPIISHVQFTGTENEQRLRELVREEEYETMDSEGNVTRTILHRTSIPKKEDEAKKWYANV
ncbi:unnamed protein product [Dracunculus medinensis]|uniref:Titin-like n=1 Tax=Dracunculus medinensis TaxID=318479 RepID=A0A0N4UD26_DRAME|nr:unnamed protein product [Dracunculus medinensis]